MSIDKIDDFTVIETAVTKSISDANGKLTTDSISSWSKITSEIVISNVISKGFI